MTNVHLLVLTYNRISTTIRCISSIIKHTDLTQHSLHILDNASDDNTGLWLLKLSQQHPNIHVYLHQQNLGVAGGREFLLNQVKTGIGGFLDSDVDVYSNTWLDPVVAILENKKIGVVGQGGHKLYPDFKYIPYSPGYEGVCDILSGYSQFFRIKDLRRNQIAIDQQFNYGGAEDDDFCLQWKAKGYTNYKIKLPIRHEFSNTWNGSLYPLHRQKLKAKWATKIEKLLV